MNKSTIRKLVWGMLFVGLTGTVLADVLLIEKVRERMQRNLPDNGLTMERVEQRYGAPLQKRAAVGDPPITRWIYNDYSVFFEYNLVIDSVLHHEAVIREVENYSARN